MKIYVWMFALLPIAALADNKIAVSDPKILLRELMNQVFDLKQEDVKDSKEIRESLGMRLQYLKTEPIEPSDIEDLEKTELSVKYKTCFPVKNNKFYLAPVLLFGEHAGIFEPSDEPLKTWLFTENPSKEDGFNRVPKDFDLSKLVIKGSQWKERLKALEQSASSGQPPKGRLYQIPDEDINNKSSEKFIKFEGFDLSKLVKNAGYYLANIAFQQKTGGHLVLCHATVQQKLKEFEEIRVINWLSPDEQTDLKEHEGDFAILEVLEAHGVYNVFLKDTRSGKTTKAFELQTKEKE